MGEIDPQSPEGILIIAKKLLTDHGMSDDLAGIYIDEAKDRLERQEILGEKRTPPNTLMGIQREVLPHLNDVDQMVKLAIKHSR